MIYEIPQIVKIDDHTFKLGGWTMHFYRAPTDAQVIDAHSDMVRESSYIRADVEYDLIARKGKV